jgi:hypothetical protein
VLIRLVPPIGRQANDCHPMRTLCGVFLNVYSPIVELLFHGKFQYDENKNKQQTTTKWHLRIQTSTKTVLLLPHLSLPPLSPPSPCPSLLLVLVLVLVLNRDRQTTRLHAYSLPRGRAGAGARDYTETGEISSRKANTTQLQHLASYTTRITVGGQYYFNCNNTKTLSGRVQRDLRLGCFLCTCENTLLYIVCRFTYYSLFGVR